MDISKINKNGHVAQVPADDWDDSVTFEKPSPKFSGKPQCDGKSQSNPKPPVSANRRIKRGLKPREHDPYCNELYALGDPEGPDTLTATSASPTDDVEKNAPCVATLKPKLKGKPKPNVPVTGHDDEDDQGDEDDALKPFLSPAEQERCERIYLGHCLRSRKIVGDLVGEDLELFDTHYDVVCALRILSFEHKETGPKAVLAQMESVAHNAQRLYEIDELKGMLKQAKKDAEGPAWHLEQLRKAKAHHAGIVALHNLRHNLEKEDFAKVAEEAAQLAKRTNDALHPVGQYEKPQNDLGMISVSALLAMDIKTEWLIDKIMVADQPMVVGGANKSLKTSMALELALTIASGTKFLGVYDTLKVSVGMYSGESGTAKIKATIEQIMEARDITAEQLDCHFSFNVPMLTDEQHCAEIRRLIRQHKLRVLIVDPLYLAMYTVKTSSGAGNIFTAGAALKMITHICQQEHCTLVLLHHFAKTRMGLPLEAPSREDLSQAGMAEWARQWILLKRIEKYNNDGKHSLWFVTGGSMGHGNTQVLRIDEGKFPERHWQTELISEDAYHVQQAEAAKAVKAQAALEKQKEELHVHQVRADAVKMILGSYPEGLSARKIRSQLGWGDSVVQGVLGWMLIKKMLTVFDTKINGKACKAYKLAPYTLELEEVPNCADDEEEEVFDD